MHVHIDACVHTHASERKHATILTQACNHMRHIHTHSRAHASECGALSHTNATHVPGAEKPRVYLQNFVPLWSSRRHQAGAVWSSGEQLQAVASSRAWMGALDAKRVSSKERGGMCTGGESMGRGTFFMRLQQTASQPMAPEPEMMNGCPVEAITHHTSAVAAQFHACACSPRLLFARAAGGAGAQAQHRHKHKLRCKPVFVRNVLRVSSRHLPKSSMSVVSVKERMPPPDAASTSGDISMGPVAQASILRSRVGRRAGGLAGTTRPPTRPHAHTRYASDAVPRPQTSALRCVCGAGGRARCAGASPRTRTRDEELGALRLLVAVDGRRQPGRQEAAVQIRAPPRCRRPHPVRAARRPKRRSGQHHRN